MTDRRGRITRGAADARASSTLLRLHLAAGVRLVRTHSKQKLTILRCADGNVRLNEGAAALLRLCDGSRTRAQIIRQASRKDAQHSLVVDIGAFLDAALARGWIVERPDTKGA